MKLRWAVFASGRGSNFKNFLHLESQLKNQEIACFHSDRECGALELARAHSKPSFVASPKSEDFQRKLVDFLALHRVNAIFLLGYMRILSPSFLSQWRGGLVNLHPSKLPLFKGKEAIKQAVDAGEKEIGVSIHEVVEAVDSGRLIKQEVIPRISGETLEGLESRVHHLEHKLVGEFLFDLDRDESMRLALSQR